MHNQKTFEKQVTRFHNSYQIDPATDCWIWTGETTMDCARFCAVVWTGDEKHIIHYAPRFSWFLKHGEVPTGFILEHTCGVKGCVNPAHLTKMTREEFLYSTRTARTSRQASQPRLTQEQVDEIRSQYAEGATIRQIQQQIGYSYKTVWQVVAGRTHL